MAEDPKRRHPSYGGVEIPARSLPPPASHPPLDGKEAEEFWAELAAVEGRALAKLATAREEIGEEVREQLGRFRAELREDFATMRDELHIAVTNGLERDLAAQRQIAEMAANQGRLGGREAGASTARIWGAAASLFALIIAAAVLALLHRAGVPIPGAIESAVAKPAVHESH